MATKINQSVIDQVLAGFTPDDLLRIASEKRLESVKSDIETYLKVDSEQTERLVKIRLVDPTWRPPTQSDRILSFLNQGGESTKAEIVKSTGIQSGIWLSLKKLQDDGKIKLDTKTDKYSAVKETEKK